MAATRYQMIVQTSISKIVLAPVLISIGKKRISVDPSQTVGAEQCSGFLELRSGM